jgi:hypothetical protein
MKKYIIIAILAISFVKDGFGYISPEALKRGKTQSGANSELERRTHPCTAPLSQIDLDINNCRVRLNVGGDVWWDPSSKEGRFIVPKVDPGSGVPAVSSIYAGSVWVGGYDSANNLKLAGMTYRDGQETDWYAGPLDEDGRTSAEVCELWDRFFVVSGDNIRQHIARYEASVLPGGEPYPCEEIPEDIKYWPSYGNALFIQKYGFELPSTSSKLAGFHDADEDGSYNPCNGDYPIIEIRGCPPKFYGDQMIFWIYNDAGNTHKASGGQAIQMEVQVQAFAWQASDAINNMTFLRYKLINKATDRIQRCYFAKWIDPDLGCHSDDYIGCDTTHVLTKFGLRSRALMYIYNSDATDGVGGCTCPGGTPTYCNDIPILGVDYFRGPQGPDTTQPGEPLIELGMSSFTYMVNAGDPGVNPAMTDPTKSRPLEFYNYMSARWRDGSHVTAGGNGYNPSGTHTNYVFPGAPNDPNGWSMCSEQTPQGDYRTVQATGPMRLDPGARNELIVGTVWVPSIEYPCPDISNFLLTDDIAQSLFDNCFDLVDGPDAPNMCIVELDQELIINLSNPTNPKIHNNAWENYSEGIVPNPGVSDSLYVFEGYKLYQLSGPTVGSSSDELADITKARLVQLVDIKNNVSKVYDWVLSPLPDGSPNPLLYHPVLKAEGPNKGVQHSFRILEDQFAKSYKKLVNHKKYYYVVIAYGHNNYSPYDFKIDEGQKKTYVEGRRNIDIKVGVPRPITDRKLNSEYGLEPQITRVDGKGASDHDLDMVDGMHDKIMNAGFDGKITYQVGKAPITVKVFNPLDVIDGDFELKFEPVNSQNVVSNESRWTIKEKNTNQVIASERSIERLNEQLIAKFGLSIGVGQSLEAGDSTLRQSGNGFIDVRSSYRTTGTDWFLGVADDQIQLIDEVNTLRGAFFNYVKSRFSDGEGYEPYLNRDPKNNFTSGVNSYFVPMYMTDFKYAPGKPFVGPVFLKADKELAEKTMKFADLQNVDIVFTKDTSKWSRCIVVEMANSYNLFTEGNTARPKDGGAVDMKLRTDQSILKTVDANGKPETVPSAGNPNSIGFGWFPGYAIDVETGERLNIFYGENSVFGADPELTAISKNPTGADMIWNPTSEKYLDLAGRPFGTNNLIMGGQHMIFVAKTKYDGCQALSNNFKSRLTSVRAQGVVQITWAGFPMLKPNTQLLSYAEGLIPNDLIVKCRVYNPFGVAVGTNSNNGLPAYEFSTKGVKATALDAAGYDAALDAINVVPNPYYGYDSYETSKFTNIVKITNLPAKCKVRIYTLDGKFIKEYNRDETPMLKGINNAAVEYKQIAPDLEWDMKNSKNIPIASGVYLIHVYSEEYGERVIKWFGVNRQFDPKGL